MCVNDCVWAELNLCGMLPCVAVRRRSAMDGNIIVPIANNSK